MFKTCEVAQMAQPALLSQAELLGDIQREAEVEGSAPHGASRAIMLAEVTGDKAVHSYQDLRSKEGHT